MARLAATDFGADWVINSDADEFWWPRGASLRDVLVAVPDRYGTVGAFLRVFVPRPGAGRFAERMTVRFSALAPINDPASLYKPIRKVIHRGHPEIRLTRGNHALVGSPFAPLCEVGSRWRCSTSRCARPSRPRTRPSSREMRSSAMSTGRRRRITATCSMRCARGRIGDYYEALVIDEAELQRGAAEARLVVDTRLRDALRAIEAGRSPVFPIAEAGRRGRVCRGGSRARRGRRRPAATTSRRVGGSPGHSRGPHVDAGLPEADTYHQARARPGSLTG